MLHDSKKTRNQQIPGQCANTLFFTEPQDIALTLQGSAELCKQRHAQVSLEGIDIYSQAWGPQGMVLPVGDKLLCCPRSSHHQQDIALWLASDTGTLTQTLVKVSFCSTANITIEKDTMSWYPYISSTKYWRFPGP